MHWGMGAGVLGCFAFVNLAQNTTDKKLKMDFMFYHKSCGTLAAMFLVPRLLIRVTSKAVAPLTNVLWERLLANASHAAMYGFIIAMPVTGVAMGYFGGKGLPFFFTTLPGAEKPHGKNAGFAFKWHKFLGWYMEMLFLGHIGGVGYHMLKGEGILARILPMAAKAAKP
jgi:cytochrome b561